MADASAPEPHLSRPAIPPELIEGIRPRLRDVTRMSAVNTRARSGAHAGPSDAELMARLAAGQIAALEAVYDRYSALVFSVSLRILNDRQLAEDVVQEVFLRLWRSPTSYDPERGRFISWLMSVTRNRALDEQRRRSRRLRVEERDDEPGREVVAHDAEDPQASAVLDEERRVVREAIACLPAEQRRVLELAYFRGLTQVEIAGETGDPLGTVKTRIRLGVRKLREALKEYEAHSGGNRGDARGA